MKIGIITFWESKNNYGQILQLYALQCALRKMGHSPFLIRYHRVASKNKKGILEKIMNFDILSFVKYRLKYIERKRALIADEKRDFDRFKNEFIIFGKDNYYDIDELKKNPPHADVYITGSDQVWNHTFFVSPEAFLLGFGSREIKRLSYAASFGITNQDMKTMIMFKDKLAAFSGISVREENGLELVQKLGYNAEWVVDPTMLFDQREWFELLKFNKPAYTRNFSIQKKQIFVYTLGNSKIQDKEKFLRYVKGLSGIKVIIATANNDPSGECYPTIHEWVYNISISRFVITTSFHGMLFCLINNTNFVVLPNTGKAEGMNSRIESMLKTVGLLDHIMNNFNEEKMNELMNKKIDWQGVNNKIMTWRTSSFQFLKRHLDQ